MDEASRSQIMEMHVNDLSVREPLIEAMRRGPGGLLGFFERADSSVLADVELVDAQNSARAIAIVDQVGWPTEALVGAEATDVWTHLIAQRVSSEALDHALPHLRDAVASGEVSALTSAQIEDRADVLAGRPQRYGTQWTQLPDVGYVPHPLDDENLVEARRADLGLGSLAEYRRRLEAMFGAA